MAEENVIKTNIVANSDMSGLISDLNRVSSSLTGLQEKLNASNKALSTQISVMNKTFAETLRSTGQFSTHFVSLTSDVDKFGSQLDKGQLKLNQFFRVYGEHAKTSGGLIRDLAKQQVQLQNAILQPLGRNAEGLMQYNVHIPRGLDTVKNKTAIARQELQIMNKVVQEGAGQLINWGKNTQWAGRQLTVGLTVPMAAFGKAAADAFKQADEQLVRLTKVYGGLTATSSAELAKVRKDVSATASELSKAYGSSFKDTIALAADIAATGKQGNELIGSVKETTRLAVLGEVDRQDAMKATLAIQTAFKQNTTELTKSINFLNAVENQTSTTLNDLVEAIPKAGPVVKGLGGDIQDLALYLTAMREGGISASEGANALKSGLASLINPTKVAKEMFAGFGIDLGKIVTSNAGNLTQTILDLQSALETLNPLQKQQALEQLFGKFQFSRMNALFANLGKQGSQTLQVLDLMKASSQDLANIAGRELSQVTESASGKYKRAVEGLKADLAGIGEQFLKINTTLINIVDGVVKFAQHLPGPIKQAMGILGMITAAAGPLIMLTGVLGNFFGYIIKGVYHFKSFFKGAEGWKLLTPEILAANKAGSLVEQTFYSDAKAAAILNQSLQGLIGSYQTLNQKVNEGIIGVNPLLAAATSSVREVNPTHPLISPEDTRSMSHLNPVSGMTTDQRMGQTLFGVVPGAPKVNQKIGGIPQMYMEGDLTKIQGLTSVGGASTGIVASEAAKWHAMTAALAMQSKSEITKLKSEVAATGLITDELSTAYQALLPQMSKLTANAAAESAAIVAEMQANKITVEQARAKIIALNAQVETMMGQAAVSTAAQLGRDIDITKVPLLDQPVVDLKTGKSNMKELLKKGRTRELLNKVAGALGVRTYGAGYSIETTRPKRFNLGGPVYLSNGKFVPGVGSQDTVPAMLTPGEFVLRKDVAQSDPQGVQALNDGQAYIVPVQGRAGGGPIFGARAINQYLGNIISRSGTLRGPANLMDKMLGLSLPQGSRYTLTGGIKTPAGKEIVGKVAKPASGVFVEESVAAELNRRLTGKGLQGETINRYLRGLLSFGGGRVIGSTDSLINSLGSHIVDSATKAQIFKEINSAYLRRVMQMKRSGNALTDSNNPYHDISSSVIQKYAAGNPALADVWSQWSKSTSSISPVYLSELQAGRGATASSGNQKIAIIDPITGQSIIIDELQGAKGQSRFLHSRNMDWESQFNFNAGGMVPSWIIRNNAIRNLTNTDPLHGPLQIGRYRAPLTIRTRRQGASIGYSGNYTPFTWDRGPRAGETSWSPRRTQAVEAFLTGSLEERGRYVTEEYMRGNYRVLQIPGAMEAMKAWGKKASGTFHRGITLRGWSKVGGQMAPLPQWLISDIEKAQATGDFSNLIGKEFLMRRSSWSSNPETAKGFGDFQLTADVKNRKVTPASQMFPELDFMTPSSTVKVNESESIFGGKFRIVGADKNGLKIETVNGPRGGNRRFGGNVSAGGSYVVGENGPEMFVPGSSGRIVPGYARGGLVTSVLGQTLLGAAGSMAGSQLGGMLGGGTGSMIGATLGGMAPFMMMGRKLKDVGDAAGDAAPALSRYGSMLAKLGMSATKFNLILGGTTLALGIAYKAYKSHQDTLKAQALGYGMTAEAAQKAGLKYVDLGSKMKEGIANAKALAEKNKLIYATLTQANTPLKISIEEYRQLKEQVSKTMPAFIDLINKTKTQEVGDLAIRLKAEFIAAGDSAENATKKVYALIEASNKQGRGVSAVANNEFGGVKTAKDAASVLAKGFNTATTIQSQAAALTASLSAIDAGITEIISKSEKAAKADKTHATQIKTYAEAQKEQWADINSKTENQRKLTAGVINEIQKQDPELAAVLNTTDDIQSAWAKYRITLQGTTLDLRNMTGAAATALNTMNEEINKVVTNNLKTGVLSGKYAQLEKLKAAQAAAAKAAAGQSAKAQIDSRKEIESLNKKIEAINKEADARKKALQEQQQDEDFLTQIKKKQLEYQEAISSGNMAGAAQTQLDIQSLTGQQQRTMAERAIDAKAAADIAPLQARIDAINAANQKVADAAALAGDKLSGLSKSITDLQATITAVDSAVALIERKMAESGPGYKGKENDLASLYKALKDAGLTGGLPTTYQTSPDLVNGKPVTVNKEFTPAQMAQNYLNALTKLTTEINTNQVIVNAKEVLSSGTPRATTPSLAPNKYTTDAKTATGLTKFRDKAEALKHLKETATDPITGAKYTLALNSKKIPAWIGAFGEVPAFKKGISKVPYDMIAMIHKNEAVLPEHVNPFNTGKPLGQSLTINVDNVTMSFAEAPENGKQLFEQFKQALQLENIKSGGRNRLIAT